MMRMMIALASATAMLALAGCSPQTQEEAEILAESAADDTAKNLDAAGEVLEEPLADVADGVSRGADAVANKLRDDDDPADELEAAPAFNNE